MARDGCVGRMRVRRSGCGMKGWRGGASEGSGGGARVIMGAQDCGSESASVQQRRVEVRGDESITAHGFAGVSLLFSCCTSGLSGGSKGKEVYSRGDCT
eukprot:748975-Hanusia_phi.AAC.1